MDLTGRLSFQLQYHGLFNVSAYFLVGKHYHLRFGWLSGGLVVGSRPEVPLAQASSKAERQLTSVLFPQPAASVASFQKPPASSLAAQQAASPAGHVWLHAKRLLQPVASVRDIAE